MRMKWQWFLGGKTMFWISILIFIILVIGFAVTYIIDPTSKLSMDKQSINPISIKTISEKYVASLGIDIDVPVEYSFARYRDGGYEADIGEEILLGTFHEWNGVYYIDISVDLYKSASLESVVMHETRHMIVEYLRDRDIIDLTKYTEEIAQQTNDYYNNLFDSGIYLLKEEENENG